MRIMLIVTNGTRIYSTLYGWSGSQEVRAFMKKKRLDRGSLKSEGHPTEEHLDIPLAKVPTTLQRLTTDEFREVQTEKVIASKVSTSIPVHVVGDDDHDEERRNGHRKLKSGRDLARRQKNQAREEAMAA